MKKEFSVRAIFAVLLGRNYGENEMDDVYNLLNHVSGRDLDTIDLVNARIEFREFIYRQLPEEMKTAYDFWVHTPDWREKFSSMEVKSAELAQYNVFSSVTPQNVFTQ